MLLDWQAALETFRDTLSSPRTQKAYEWVGMQAPAVRFVVELTIQCPLSFHALSRDFYLYVRPICRENP